MDRLAVLIAVALVAVSCSQAAPPTSPLPTTEPSTTLTTEPSTTTTTAPATTTAPTTTATSLPEPPEGWGRFEVDPGIFGAVTLTDGAAAQGRFVLVGCRGFDNGAPGFPVWWSDNATSWQRALGPGDVGCFTQVEASPFGYFAAGLGVQNQFHSEDGVSWAQLDLSGDLGFDHPGQLGVVFAIFVSPADDRVTLLYSRAAEAESRIATLVTTTDGQTWEPGPADSAALFHSSDISAVIEGGPGLIAVGASPGGEFVPSAAVFTSPDGLTWSRVTPRDADFNDKVMSDVLAVGTGYLAVGGDFETGLMTAWTSPDGIVWSRSQPPPEQTDPSVAHMIAEAVTRAGGFIWAAGRDFDARRDDNGLPAMWVSDDGLTWDRVDFDEATGVIPFALIDTPNLRIGVWPPPFSLSRDPVQIFGAD